MASYYCAIHPLGELFSCRPYNAPEIRSSLWRVRFVLSIPWASYFCVEHLILHLMASYFLCRPFNCPSVHPFGKLFLCRPSLGKVISCQLFTSPSCYPFGELFLLTVLISFLTLVWRVEFCYIFISVSFGYLKYMYSMVIEENQN